MKKLVENLTEWYNNNQSPVKASDMENTMLSLESWNPTLTPMEVVRSVWDRLRTHLENEKARIYEAIGNYPTPIAGCDQQFNYLLEEQTRIRLELDRLNRSSHENLTAGDAIQRLNEFIDSSSYVDSQTEQTIRAYLQEGLSQIQR